MDQGRVIADGSATEVLADAAVVAAYLGTTAAAIDRSTPGIHQTDTDPEPETEGAAVP